MEQKPIEQQEQSDLQAFTSGFSGWWERWGTYVLVVILIVVGGFAAKRWADHFRTEAHEKRWGELSRETSVPALKGIAEDNAGTIVEAIAYLRAGDAALSQATFPKAELSMATMPATAPSTDPKKALEDAEGFYKRAIASSACPKIVKLNAELGLAAIAEAKGNWDEAAKAYKSLIDASGPEFEPIRKQAQSRLDYIARAKAPLVLAPPPAPKPAGSGESFDFLGGLKQPGSGSPSPSIPFVPLPAPTTAPSDKP